MADLPRRVPRLRRRSDATPPALPPLPEPLSTDQSKDPLPPGWRRGLPTTQDGDTA